RCKQSGQMPSSEEPNRHPAALPTDKRAERPSNWCASRRDNGITVLLTMRSDSAGAAMRKIWTMRQKRYATCGNLRQTGGKVEELRMKKDASGRWNHQKEPGRFVSHRTVQCHPRFRDAFAGMTAVLPADSSTMRSVICIRAGPALRTSAAIDGAHRC